MKKKNQNQINNSRVIDLTGDKAQKFLYNNFGDTTPIESLHVTVMEPENIPSETDNPQMTNAIDFDPIVVNPYSNNETYTTIYPSLLNNVLLGKEFADNIYNTQICNKDLGRTINILNNRYVDDIEESFNRVLIDRFEFFKASFYTSIYAHMNSIIVYLYGPSYNMNILNPQDTIADRMNYSRYVSINREIDLLVGDIKRLPKNNARNVYMDIIYSKFIDVFLPNIISDTFTDISILLRNIIYRNNFPEVSDLSISDNNIQYATADFQNQIYQNMIRELSNAICMSYPAAIIEVTNIVNIINQNMDIYRYKASRGRDFDDNSYDEYE